MLRSLAVLFFTIQAQLAAALCEGADLIAALPEAKRAALAAEAAALPYPEGLLWRATRGETEITLFGTYHFRHRDTQAHLDRLAPEIARAEAVFLEMSPADTKRFQTLVATDLTLMFITEGPTLPDLLGEADWGRYAAEMSARQIPGFMAAKFKPLWAAMLLGVGPCEARNGAVDGEGIDLLIGERAEALGVPAVSLEDFAGLLGVLDDEPLDKQLDLIRLSLAWTGSADDMSYTIRERYLAQQIALTWEFSRLISLQAGGPTADEDFDRLEKILLTDRNIAWTELLLRAAEGRTVLVAVGAGHLPGETGLLRLLENDGFNITRLPL